MGQTTSFESTSTTARRRSGDPMTFTNELDFLHEQIRKHSLTLRQLTLITFDELHLKIGELNSLSSKYVDINGKQLLFEISPGTDQGLLWKGSVRIKCIKMDPENQRIERSRELNLKQFLQVFNTMQMHLSTERGTTNLQTTSSGNPETDPSPQSTPETSKRGKLTLPPGMDASILLEKLAEENITGDECCICMESKPQVSLPCAHSYCLACIEQWNVDHKTCPICREKLETTDDTWVLEEVPSNQDVSHEIQKSLFELTR